MTAMLRAIALASVALFAVLLLYLPSTAPAPRFLDLVRAEHERYADVWGPVHADRILSRALDLFEPNIVSVTMTSVSSATDVVPGQALLAHRLSQAIDGLLHNAYVHSLQSLLLLATHRVCALLEWAPEGLVLILAACADGWVVRRIKAHEFRQHRPELYAVGTLVIALMIGPTLVLSITPVPLHPLAFATLAPLIAFGGRTAVANYHHAV